MTYLKIIVVGLLILLANTTKIYAQVPVFLNFEANQNQLPPDQEIKLIIDQAPKLAFIHINFSFDQSKINLVDEITPSDQFHTLVQKTSMAEANANGKVSLALAISPDQKSNPPEGKIELAKFNLTHKSHKINDSTQITIDSWQIINADGQLMTINTNPLSLILNPQVEIMSWFKIQKEIINLYASRKISQISLTLKLLQLAITAEFSSLSRQLRYLDLLTQYVNEAKESQIKIEAKTKLLNMFDELRQVLNQK